MLCIVAAPTWAVQAEPPRLIVSTDIGGTDFDDFQSLVHLLLYADKFEIEGLISSPYGPGRKGHILEVLQAYEKDYPKLRTWSENYPSPQALRAVTKQGETEVAPYRGYGQPTEGSEWIVARAREKDPRPLYLLVWGGLEDLAQALHDAPDILPKLRVYYIGGPNKKWSPDAYQYIADHHRDLWMIEANSTYRGWFTGGESAEALSAQHFTKAHVVGRGALGDFFAEGISFDGQRRTEIRMGDTPAVAWLLHGNPEMPFQGGWGGRFVRAWERPHSTFDRLTTVNDTIEFCAIMELALPLSAPLPRDAELFMDVENQSLPGHFPGDGTVRFRFCPKAAKTYTYSLRGNVPEWNGGEGAVSVVLAPPSAALAPDDRWPNWWTDDPAPALAEGDQQGARTVSQWRTDFMQDFAARFERCRTAAP